MNNNNRYIRPLDYVVNNRYIRPLDYVERHSNSEQLEPNVTDGISNEVTQQNVTQAAKINPLAMIDAFPTDPSMEEARDFWHDWEEMLRMIFQLNANVYATDQVKLSVLLAKGGNFIRKILSPHWKDLSFDHAVDLIKEYFSRNANPLADEASFHRLHQDKEESFEKFTDRVIKKARVFGITDERRLTAQVTAGALHSERLIDYAIRGDTSLSSVIAYGNQVEVLRRQRPVAPETIPQEVNWTKGKDSKYAPYPLGQRQGRSNWSGSKAVKSVARGGTTADCDFCGLSHASGRCPAWGKQCNICKKMNHFARVCRGKEQKQEVQIVNMSSRLCFVDCWIAGVRVECLVDSGATVNIVDQSIWSRIEEARKLDRSSHRLSELIIASSDRITVFGGTQIRALLSFCAVIEVCDTSKPAAFARILVVEGTTRSILSKETSEALRILKTGLEVNAIQWDEQSGEEFPSIPGKFARLDIDQAIQPIQIPRVRIPIALEEPVKKRINQMLAQGIIERAESTNSFVSPMSVVAKGSGDFRIVIDMREANKAIKRKYHPLPVMENLFQKLSGAKCFTTLDLKSAYHQIKLHPDSRSITTFMSQLGAMQFTRLVFGMNAAPEIFQETIDEILAGCSGCLAYLDDILVFGESLKKLEERTNRVMEKLANHNLVLNSKKCKFNQNTVEFLGFKVDAEGIHPTDEKIELIDSFKRPSDLKELRSFLGMITFLGSFIKNLATVLEPLRYLTRSDVPFIWRKEQEEAFKKIKQMLKEDLETQAFFSNSRLTKLYTDASGVGLGAVLTQIQENGDERVIMYASKSLTKTEKVYPQVHREALAVVWAVEKFSHYLLGREFVIVTDNTALKQLYSNEVRDTKRTAMRFDGWHLRLAPFNYQIQNIAGTENIAADALSRLCTIQAIPYQEEREILELGQVVPEVNALWDSDMAKTISLEVVREQSKEDVFIREVLKALATGKWDAVPKSVKPFASEFFMKDDILFRNHQIVLPESLKQQALLNAHVAHSGVVVMKRSLRSRVWWPRLDKDVQEFVQRCLGCLSTAKDDAPEPMTRTLMPHRAMDFIAIDHWSAAALATKLLVVTDYYSRYLWVKAVSGLTSAESIEACTEIFNIFGKPKTIRADNGTAFSSDEFKTWCKDEGINLNFSIPLWPQHNGQVENAMKLINKTMRIARVNQDKWKDALARAIQFHNNIKVHSITGVTPAELMFNRRLRESLPTSTMEPLFDKEEVRETDTIRKEQGKETADSRRHAKESAICVGDEVFMRAKAGDKLSAKFDVSKPCEVLEKEGTKVIVKTSDGRTFTRSSTALKKNYNTEQTDKNGSTAKETDETKIENDIVMREGTPEEDMEVRRDGVTLRNRAHIRPPNKLSLGIELV